jgi:signal transduction histidine kinase
MLLYYKYFYLLLASYFFYFGATTLLSLKHIKNKVVYQYLALCLGAFAYAFLIFFRLENPHIDFEQAGQYFQLMAIAGGVAFYFYLQVIINYLKLTEKKWTIFSRIALFYIIAVSADVIFSQLGFISTMGIAKDNSYFVGFSKLLRLDSDLTIFGKIVNMIFILNNIGCTFFIGKKLLTKKPVDYWLFYGVVLTLVTVTNDVLSMTDVLNKSIALGMLGFGLETFRFGTLLQKESFNKLNLFKGKLRSMSKIAEVGLITSTIQHDISNPLAIIQMRSKLALKKDKDSQYAKAVIKNCDRILNIISTYTRFLHNETKAKELHNCQAIVDEAISLCEAKLKLKQITDIKMDICPELEINCIHDDVILAIMNIISNASDAIEKLKEKWISITVVENKDEIKFLVQDSGNGIDESIIKDIFNLQFTTKEEGNGLGLHLIKTLLADEKIDLYVDNNFSNTTFVLSFPKN